MIKLFWRRVDLIINYLIKRVITQEVVLDTIIALIVGQRKTVASSLTAKSRKHIWIGKKLAITELILSDRSRLELMQMFSEP